MKEFLSTPSARRATSGEYTMFSIEGISIHALREEGDRRFEQRRRNLQRFLSTPSARRATCCCHPAFEVHTISIHALREEGDS